MTTEQQLRQKRNKELMEEVKLGYNCAPLPMQYYFYPPRPIIKKDKNCLDFLFRKPKLSVVE